MSGTEKKVRINYLGTESIVTTSELDKLLAEDSTGGIEIMGPAGGVDSVYVNRDDRPVRETLSAEQLRRRKASGETNIVFGPNDPKLDLVRRADKEAMKKDTAEDFAWLAAIRPMVPGIQIAENIAVGKEDAVAARHELLTTYPGKLANMAGQVGSMLLAGKALSAVLPAEAAAALPLSARTSMLGKTAQVATENFLFDTKLYADHIYNYDQEFSLEDWGNQAMVGFIMASPFIFSFQARAAVGIGLEKARAWAGPKMGSAGVQDALGFARNAGVSYALLKGGPMVGKIHQKAAGLGVVQRVINRVTRKGRKGGEILDNPLQAFDDAMQAHIKERGIIEELTPQKMGGAKTAKEVEAMKEVLRNATAEELKFLDDLNPKQMIREMNATRTSLKSLENPGKQFNKKVGRPAALDMDVEMINEAAYEIKIQSMLDDISDAGYGDVLGYIKNIEYLDKPNIAYQKLVKARVDSRIGKHSSAPGAEVADLRIAEILEDADVWGAEVAGRGTKINEGINKVTDNFKTIEEFRRQFPDYYERVDAKTVNGLNGVDAAISEIQSGYETLRAQGILSEEIVRTLDNSLKKTQDQLRYGKEQFIKAKQINDARAKAIENSDVQWDVLRLGRANKEISFPRQHAEAALEEGASLASFKEFASKAFEGTTKALKNPASAQIPSFGVLASRYLSTEEERREIFRKAEEQIRAMQFNPQALAEQVAQMTANLEVQEPVATQILQQKISASFYYLASQLPPKSETPFNNDFPHHISVVDQFVDKLMATYEPLSVGMAATMGLATPGMVEAVKYTNPSVYAQMYGVLAEAIMETPPEQRVKIPDEIRNGIETFMGGYSVMHQGASLIQLQSNYAQTAAEEQQIRGGQPTGSTMNNPGPQNAGSDYTFTQRITGF